MADLTLTPISPDRAKLEQYVALLQSSFPGAKERFTHAYLSWLYLENPDGKVVGFDAWDGEHLAAHYACIPIKARFGAARVPALLSLNTATHPNYQGRGLFTKLAAATYDLAGTEGYEGVVGVANANSTPGFLKRLSFQSVSPLRTLIGFGPLGFDAGALEANASHFMREWSAAAIRWRVANPLHQVRTSKSTSDVCSFASRSGYPGVVAWSERPRGADWRFGDSLSFGDRGARVFVGLFPAKAAPKFRLFIDLPDRLRPAPLNFIYRSLQNSAPAQIDSERMFFDFLDFDAF